MLLKGILISVGLLISQLVQSQDRTTYIELYKDVAMSEMMRTGIPASIKLAQAMLESACGKSDLACKANNHFGIKCGNEWKGKSFHKEDDDYKDGALVKSCFREFSTVYDSYIAHSDFLTDPGKRNRYGFLFELDATDYKGWARGLSKAGYATDPQYATRLIDMIEDYELYKFDAPLPAEYVDAGRSKRNQKTNITTTYRYHNEVKYVTAQAGDTPLSVASRNDVSPNQIVKYNDDIDDDRQFLVTGSRVYLQPKRNANRGKQKVHLIKQGETLVSISQMYGINIEALRNRNGMEEGQMPATNQKLYVRGKNPNKIRTVNIYDSPDITPEREIREVASASSPSKAPPEVVKSPKTPTQNKPAAAKTTKPSTTKPSTTTKPVSTSKPPVTQQASAGIKMSTSDLVLHTVIKGDTLYSLSRQYGLSVAELKKMNNLSADTISIGQKLALK
ncbi:MAG: LysM peptidoglycan-binding domain-containing protein [Bacteroidota bacterium]|nr:LysM peptidoglycan-binding domain-containing protein [Bacteroidota bacterium]